MFRTRARRYFPVQNVGFGLGNLDGLKYSIRDKFSDTQAAGFTSPRNANVGQLFRFNDSNNLVSIDSGDLVINGTAVASYTNPAYYYTSVAKANGLTLIWRIIGSGVIRLGFSGSSTLANTNQTGFLVNGTALQYMSNGNFNFNIGTWSSLSTYLLAKTYLTNGGFILRVKGGDYSTWKTLFNETNGSWTVSTSIFPSVSIAGAVVARIGDVWAYQPTSGKLLSSSTLNVNNPDTTILTSTLNSTNVLQGTVTAGSAGKLLELRYRQADANNYMLSRVEWNGSAYQYVTGHVIAGIETLQGSPVVGLTGNGNVFRMQVQVNGNTHRYYTSPSTNWTKQYADITDSNGASNLGVSVRNVGFTSTSLITHNYDDAEINTLLDRIAV
jgi:hypothetical protein